MTTIKTSPGTDMCRPNSRQPDAFGAWHPMGTAPRQGEVIILLARYYDALEGFEHPIIGQYDSMKKQWFDIIRSGNERTALICLGWMPRPEFVNARTLLSDRYQTIN